MDQNPYKTDGKEAWQAFGLVSAIGVDLASCVVAGVFLGKWLDGLWGTTPWMLLLGILLGLTGGVLGVVKLLQKYGPEARSKKQ
ncbi:AtpZ/AtpI family protein [Tumebacillus sp. ITR2]|uniref:AtpZ/AtpI family protein n=1 Tax=Tumebacillus amylolyticus TaxID=2801339 RepID=A0ABS1J8S9_9BACL|nr:AtpZ/AtpI family protein [Tumebacillus amylolyticus]MBL0386682.1 AtpZ/AtpI family protein [Tumebacillus amylolyticus]